MSENSENVQNPKMFRLLSCMMKKSSKSSREKLKPADCCFKNDIKLILCRWTNWLMIAALNWRWQFEVKTESAGRRDIWTVMRSHSSGKNSDKQHSVIINLWSEQSDSWFPLLFSSFDSSADYWRVSIYIWEAETRQDSTFLLDQ